MSENNTNPARADDSKICGDSKCLVKGPQFLPAFPRNRQRRDGRSLYCKDCCRRRVHEGRANERERRAARKRLNEIKQPVILRKRPGRDERVLAAVQLGARTQAEIKRLAKVASNDDLGLSLAALIIDRGLVKSELVGGGRVYVPASRQRSTTHHV